MSNTHTRRFSSNGLVYAPGLLPRFLAGMPLNLQGRREARRLLVAACCVAPTALGMLERAKQGPPMLDSRRTLDEMASALFFLCATWGTSLPLADALYMAWKGPALKVETDGETAVVEIPDDCAIEFHPEGVAWEDARSADEDEDDEDDDEAAYEEAAERQGVKLRDNAPVFSTAMCAPYDVLLPPPNRVLKHRDDLGKLDASTAASTTVDGMWDRMWGLFCVVGGPGEAFFDAAVEQEAAKRGLHTVSAGGYPLNPQAIDEADSAWNDYSAALLTEAVYHGLALVKLPDTPESPSYRWYVLDPELTDLDALRGTAADRTAALQAYLQTLYVVSSADDVTGVVVDVETGEPAVLPDDILRAIEVDPASNPLTVDGAERVAAALRARIN